MIHKNYDSLDNIGNIYKKHISIDYLGFKYNSKTSLVGVYNLYTYDKFYFL